MVLEFANLDLIIFVTSFLFVFAIVFALLAYSKIFKDNKYASAIIAAVIGLITAIYAPFAFFIQNILPIAAILLVFVFFIVFIKAIFGSHNGEGKEKKTDVLPAAIALAIMLVLLAGVWSSISDFIGLTVSMSETLLWIIGIVVVLAIFIIAYKLQSEKVA